MNRTHETRNRWADKIAFFGLFIAVLLIARLMVVSRSAIVLSKPIKLDFAELSVCIPTGNGWQSENFWKYQQNTFTLDSFFYPSPGRITAIISCRYLLAALETSPDKLFEGKASEMGRSRIAKTGQIEIGGSDNAGLAVLNWAHIESLFGSRKETKTLFDTFFGVAQLPNGRRLDIEVYQTTDDADLAEEIFNSVINSIKFTDNPLLEAGGRTVTEIKDKGLDRFLISADKKQGQNEERFFLIKDARGKSIGFTMEALRCLESGRFMAMSYYYIRGQYDQEQATLFQGVNNLTEFAWESRTSSPGSRSGAEIVLSENGIMTIKEFDRRAEEKTYQIGPAAIPDVLGEFILGQMLDSNEKEILVDIIDADGKIIPALVSRIEAGHPSASQDRSGADAAMEEAAYVFRVELLDGRRFSEQVYLDDQRQVSRRLLHQENTYTLERTGKEIISGEFPEKGDYILQKKDKILEQNRLQESSEQQPPAANQ